MKRPRPIEVLGPVALSVGILVAVGVLRDSNFGSTAFGMDPPFSQPASSIPSGRAPVQGGAPVVFNAGTQRVEQIEVMQEVLVELRAIRKFLQTGSIAVRLEEVPLDYDRLAETLSGAMSQAKAGASAGSDGSSGGVRRITRAEETEKESSD